MDQHPGAQELVAGAGRGQQQPDRRVDGRERLVLGVRPVVADHAGGGRAAGQDDDGGGGQEAGDGQTHSGSGTRARLVAVRLARTPRPPAPQRARRPSVGGPTHGTGRAISLNSLVRGAVANMCGRWAAARRSCGFAGAVGGTGSTTAAERAGHAGAVRAGRVRPAPGRAQAGRRHRANYATGQPGPHAPRLQRRPFATTARSRAVHTGGLQSQEVRARLEAFTRAVLASTRVNGPQAHAAAGLPSPAPLPRLPRQRPPRPRARPNGSNRAPPHLRPSPRGPPEPAAKPPARGIATRSGAAAVPRTHRCRPPDSRPASSRLCPDPRHGLVRHSPDCRAGRGPGTATTRCSTRRPSCTGPVLAAESDADRTGACQRGGRCRWPRGADDGATRGSVRLSDPVRSGRCQSAARRPSRVARPWRGRSACCNRPRSCRRGRRC